MTTYDEYTQHIYQTALAYNNAPVLIEFSSMGPTIAEMLVNNYEYDNIIHTESAGAQGKRISEGAGKMIDKGVKMTLQVRATGCSLLKALIEGNQLIVHDFDTIEELSRFSKKGNKFVAEEGWNDDLVMGLVILAWFSNQQYFKDLTDNNPLKHVRDQTEEELLEGLIPFGFIMKEDPLPKVGDENYNHDQVLLNAFKNIETLPNF